MTFADVAEVIGRRQSKYEKLLTDALASGDRFSKNSAELMLDRVSKYREELFQTQEAVKAQMGYGGEVAMAYGGRPRMQYGGEPPFRVPTSPMEVEYSHPLNADLDFMPVRGINQIPRSFGTVTPTTSTARMSFTPSQVDAPFYTRPGTPGNAQPMQGFVPAFGASPGAMNTGTPNPSWLDTSGFPLPETTGVGSTPPSARTSGGGFKNMSSQDKAVGLSAATSVASSLMSMYAANKMQGPRRPITLTAPRLNTDVNIAPQLNELDQSTMAFERSLTRSGLPGTQGMALSRRNAADRTRAGLYQTKQQQEQQLRNQELMLDYQNQAANAGTMNQFQEAERNFANERAAFMNRASTQALGSIQLAMRDKAMMDLDKEKAAMTYTGYNERVVSELAGSMLKPNMSPSEVTNIKQRYGDVNIRTALERLKGRNRAEYDLVISMFPEFQND
jgi:hypothetical protein